MNTPNGRQSSDCARKNNRRVRGNRGTTLALLAVYGGAVSLPVACDFSDRDGVLNDGATGWSVSTKPLAGFDKPNNEQPVIAEIVVTVWDPRKASLDKYELRHFQTYGNGS